MMDIPAKLCCDNTKFFVYHHRTGCFKSDDLKFLYPKCEIVIFPDIFSLKAME